MPNYRRRRVSGGSYFFTVNLLNRRSHLLVEQVSELRRAFASVQASHPFEMDAAVILPDHLHVIWTLPAGDHDYSTRWRLVKTALSRSINNQEARSRSRERHRERGVWQRRFWEHALRDEQDYEAHVDYIHYNPVKHGLVTRHIDWPWSSLHQYVTRGILTSDWGIGWAGSCVDRE